MNSTKVTINAKPKQVVKRLLAVLPERAKDVLVGRFGLGKDSGRLTLESIGKKYGITRERVRQIENYAIHSIKKSDVFNKEKETFVELEKLLELLGGIISEEDLLSAISNEKSTQNHVHFLLVLGDAFKKEKEDDHFRHRWFIDDKLAEKVHGALRKLYESMNDDHLVSELDVIAQFLTHVEDVSDHYKKEDIVRRWLSISKTIGKNPLGEWGLVSSPNIRAKGIRDYAFLVLRKHGSPIHLQS
jgi:hypothetical protein